MSLVQWCWGDVLANPKTKQEKAAFNSGSSHALAGGVMVSDYSPRNWLRPFWIAGWRVTRMTVLAGACGPIISTPEQVREALARQRSGVHRRAIGPVFNKLGV